METQKIWNSQNNLEKEKQLEESRFSTSDNTTKLQSSKQYGTDIKKNTHTEINATENRAPKEPINLWKRRQGYTMEKYSLFNKVTLGKLDSYL